MSHVLVPTDFSVPAQSALDYAVRHLKKLNGADSHLTVLAVIEEVIPAGAQFEMGSGFVDTKAVIDEAEQQATRKLEELRQLISAELKVEVKVLRAAQPVHTEIIEYAKSHAVDLLVLASHGRTGIRRFILGSVVERVVREAPCPVLVVPPTPDPS